MSESACGYDVADPCFGNGQSLALRDVRVLSESLLRDAESERAAAWYAAEYDAYFGALHRLEGWYAQVWPNTNPALQPVREHAAAAEERGDVPDNTGKGPAQMSDDAARLRFVGF